MKLTADQAKKFFSKLEYRFKKSDNPLVEKLSKGEEVELTEDEVSLLTKKFEYKFKKSEDSDLLLLKEVKTA